MMDAVTACRMRAWMQAQGAPWPLPVLRDAMGLAPGPGHEEIRAKLKHFLRRGEVEQLPGGRYQYRHGWKKEVPPRADVIYRAMYVTPEWSNRDLLRLSGASDSGWSRRIIRRLIRQGLVEVAGVRTFKPMPGRERVFRLSDRDRFRKEVMR